MAEYKVDGDMDKVRRIALQGAAALAYCHQMHILHKDIKPGNFFFRDKEHTELVLGDFGISSMIEDDGKAHKTTQARTPIYAAPEMYKNEPYDGVRADIFSLGVILLNSSINSELGIDASLLGYDGLYALITGTSQATLFITIMNSIFVPSEFAHGTMKNIASRGLSRWSIYLSKLIVGIVVSVIYVLLCAVCSFALGSIMWGAGDIDRAMSLDIARMLGLFLLAEVAVQSIFIMFGFIVRHTGGTSFTNLGIIILAPTLILPIINFGLSEWCKLEDFDISNYWPATYLSKYLSLDILQEDIVTGIIVCCAFIVITTALGIFSFYKRDIK